MMSATTVNTAYKIFQPQHQETYLRICALSEDSEQSAYNLGPSSSLDSVFVVRLKTRWIVAYPNAHKEDSDQTARMRRSESSLGAHVRWYGFSRYG